MMIKTSTVLSGLIWRLLVLAAGLTSAQGAVTIVMTETGGNVEFVLSGSLDITGASLFGPGTLPTQSINPASPSLVMGATASGDLFGLSSAPGNFGAPGFTPATSAAGDAFFLSSNPAVFLPTGYSSGSSLSSSMTFNSATFASLGIDAVNQPYVWAAPSGDTITLTTVPEPTLALLSLVGIAALGLRRRRS